MQLNTASSIRIDLLRFPLIVGVVFVHAYKSDIGFSGGQLEFGGIEPVFFVDFIKILVSQSIARLAVPIFFLMSGYLFFFGLIWSGKTYLAKLQNRVKTLLIPFLFWNLGTIGIYALVQELPATKYFLSGNTPTIAEFTTYEFLDAVIGFHRPQIAFQFWFIRDLIIMVLITPVINIIARYSVLVFGLAACWFLDYWPVYIPMVTSVFFFTLGAYLAKRKTDLFFLDSYGLLCFFGFGVFALLDACYYTDTNSLYIHNLAIMFGVSASLFGTKMITQNERLKNSLLQLSSASFFVFAIHEPLLTIIRKLSFKLTAPHTAYDILLLYFVNPLLTIGLALLIFRLLLALTPKLLTVITGGR